MAGREAMALACISPANLEQKDACGSGVGVGVGVGIANHGKGGQGLRHAMGEWECRQRWLVGPSGNFAIVRARKHGIAPVGEKNRIMEQDRGQRTAGKRRGRGSETRRDACSSHADVVLRAAFDGKCRGCQWHTRHVRRAPPFCLGIVLDRLSDATLTLSSSRQVSDS